MAYKRVRKSAMTSKKVYKRNRRLGPKKTLNSVKNIRKVVDKVLSRKMETKSTTSTSTDGVQILHNSFVNIDPTTSFFQTSHNVADPMNGFGHRIGDQVTIKGISMKMMIELNERYSMATFRLILVRSAKGDTPDRSTLFRGQSGNKMLDGFNTERYTIMFSKTFTIRAPNQATIGPTGTVDLLPAGYNAATSADQVLSRGTRIVKIYIPGTKFGKGGTIQYESQNTQQTKFFDYNLLLFAYSNFTTSQDIFNVGRVNDYIKTVYYTDA